MMRENQKVQSDMAVSRTVRMITTIVLSMLLLTSCDRLLSPGEKRSQSSSATLPVPVMQWVDTPHLDLKSSLGTFVRAFFESTALRYDRGMSVTYPGYTRAISPISQSVADGIPPYNANRFSTGTEGFSVLRVTRIENATTVFVCTLRGRSAYPDSRDPEKFELSGPDGETGINRITIVTDGVSPPADQVGPRAAPVSDVFGGWTLSEYELYSGVPPVTELDDECKALASRPEHNIPGPRIVDSLPAPGAPYPGWP